MRKQFGEYRRLARGVFGCSSLWAGREHLLYVRGTGLLLPVVEDYIRVRYRDLRSVAVVRTYTSLWWNLVYGAGCVLFALPVVYFGVSLHRGQFDPDGEAPFAIVMLAILVVPALAAVVGLVWNLALGKSCLLSLQTGQGSVRVRAARRVRTANRVRDGIRATIDERLAAAATHQPGEGVR